MSKGYVYILTNPMMPRLIKISRTTNKPDERAADLSKSSGVPAKYEVAFSVLVSDCEYVEKTIHKKLSPERPNPYREFFFTKCKCGVSNFTWRYASPFLINAILFPLSLFKRKIRRGNTIRKAPGRIPFGQEPVEPL
tara:strand:+ start:898 stop:1308 length:411 start_codon:yes stop_codon:yes gene_type:complete